MNAVWDGRTTCSATEFSLIIATLVKINVYYQCFIDMLCFKALQRSINLVTYKEIVVADRVAYVVVYKYVFLGYLKYVLTLLV
jgi:hypothetical protein